MDYEKNWKTLKAESGGRWCQPHPMSNDLLTIGELMRNIERRASELSELAATAANTGMAAEAAQIADEMQHFEDTMVCGQNDDLRDKLGVWRRQLRHT